MGGTCAHVEEERCLLCVGGETCRKETALKIQHQLEGSSKMDLKELSWEGMDWIYLAEEMDKWQAFMDTVMQLWVP